ncbi:MAG TPA: family 1 glycosylhydrolase [Flavisolibacter sp.]|jgi:dTDP-4-dehydrorhamnose reductase|nr:family 1 glycosylhydrolase [Flavisolibacter sp.]
MDKQIQYCNPEVWGGIECTINRVKNNFIDQLHCSGHYYREDDIEHIAQLGIKKLRYPILWEKHQPERDRIIDWSWISKQLSRIKEKNIGVIAGLVHHGSGPAYTNLADENFPYYLAEYAKKVAEQFPWIEYYTPVNEPLTTARFSGLYGIWYPHQNNSKAFTQMLLNELKGTVLAMQEIRKINPNAKLVQTEDLGKTYSTKKLKYQADFENERRWLTYDLLCGRFGRNHYLWQHFQHMDIPEKDIYFFQENICTPDVFGFNHYLTSERYLDERLYLYPAHTHGGNGRHHYADVEVVRVNIEEETGIEVLMKEAWQRYHQPIAITEVHLHCTREEQLRWFKHVWQSCNNLVQQGADIKAVTSWAMLGSYGWNKLLTQDGGDYEPGAFDLRGGQLRTTALANFIKTVAQNNNCDHHLAEEKGWWLRDARLLYGSRPNTIQMKTVQSSPVLIIGKNGTLGRAFARVCEERFINYQLLSRQDCDISNTESVEAAIELHKPWAIINAAGFVRVDDAEKECDACIRDNTTGPQNLAIACNKYSVQLINFSSDLVFDGKKPTAYYESDMPNPLNVYGQTKAQAEILVQKECSSSLIIRTSAFFGPWDEYNFVHYVRKALSNYETITVAKDLFISPTYVPHLVNACLDILIDRETGTWHLVNKGSLSWAEFAFLVADKFDLDKSLINAVNAAHLNYPAIRPFNSVLASERGQLLPSFESAMNEYMHQQKILKEKKVA